jgi:hypothetical protein
VFDRRGRVVDHVLNRCTCPGRASSDALWLTRAGNTTSEAIVRMGIDRSSGHFAARQDTVYYGIFTSFAVTNDGTALALDDGTYEYSSWAVDLADALRGTLPDARRVLRASSPVSAAISPDGQRVLLTRVIPTSAGEREVRNAVLPFGGGPEVPVHLSHIPLGAWWVDSVTIGYAALSKTGLHAALVDVRTSAERQPLDLGDSTVGGLAPLPDGWAWLPVGGQRIAVQGPGGRHEIAKPAWAANFQGLGAPADGRSLVTTAWNTGTNDTLRVDVVPTAGGNATPWISAFAETGSADVLPDGSVLFTLFSREQSATLLRLRGPGQVERMGTVPRPVSGITVSHDLRRATVNAQDYHGDVWLSKVGKP